MPVLVIIVSFISAVTMESKSNVEKASIVAEIGKLFNFGMPQFSHLLI